MNEEFPKTLNSALDIAGKVHGSITDLVKALGDLQADLAGLTPAMNQALAVMKTVPADAGPAPVPPEPAPPVAPPKPAAVSEGTKSVEEKSIDLPKPLPSDFPHTSTPKR